MWQNAASVGLAKYLGLSMRAMLLSRAHTNTPCSSYPCFASGGATEPYRSRPGHTNKFAVSGWIKVASRFCSWSEGLLQPRRCRNFLGWGMGLDGSCCTRHHVRCTELCMAASQACYQPGICRPSCLIERFNACPALPMVARRGRIILSFMEHMPTIKVQRRKLAKSSCQSPASSLWWSKIFAYQPSQVLSNKQLSVRPQYPAIVVVGRCS